MYRLLVFLMSTTYASAEGVHKRNIDQSNILTLWSWNHISARFDTIRLRL